MISLLLKLPTHSFILFKSSLDAFPLPNVEEISKHLAHRTILSSPTVVWWATINYGGEATGAWPAAEFGSLGHNKYGWQQQRIQHRLCRYSSHLAHCLTPITARRPTRPLPDSCHWARTGRGPNPTTVSRPMLLPLSQPNPHCCSDPSCHL